LIGGFLYLRGSLRGSPQEMALVDIGRAERLYREAQAAAGNDPDRIASVGRSGRLLSEAHVAFDAKNFPEARAAAQQAQTFAEKLLEGQQGDAFAARIFKFEGDVKVKRAREFVWASLSGNTALRVGDQIKTASSGSAQIIYFDGTITTIKPGSLLEIRELFEDPTTRVRKVREKLNWGGVSATMPGANVAGSFHPVATESATARGVEKSEFQVAYDAQTRKTRTDVQSGTAEIETGGKSLTLKPLERMEVSAGQVISKVKLLPAPPLLEPSDQRVFLHDD